jgi:ElaA protein
MSLHWNFCAFDELTPAQLYKIMHLRNEVFVVEQNCVYQDADHKDQPSFHVMGFREDELAAYCRIIPPGISYGDPSIGRVVTSPSHRRSGYGRQLMARAIDFTLQRFSCRTITIGAQVYLRAFYGSLGFTPIGDTYLEDNIPHIAMRYTA